MSTLIKMLLSVGITCAVSVVVAHFFIEDSTSSILFGMAVGSLSPMVYALLDHCGL